jgi:hypothetical protein
MARKDRMMMKAHLNEAADKGRKGDTYLAHMTGGELVLPKEFASDPQIRALIDAKFKSNGVSTDRYVVGNKENSINPETGQPEFGFKLKQFVGTAIGATIGFLTGVPGAAVTGAKIGATVDATRAISDAQDQAKTQAAEAQATAIQQAQLARDAAAAQAQQARDAAAEQAKLTRAQQTEIINQQSKSTQDQIDAQKAGLTTSLEQARLTAAQQAEMLRNLTVQQTASADAAKAQLYQQQKQYEEQKLSMEKQAKDQASALDAERRKIAERESAQMTARRRAGKRSLLSSARMNPELGIASGVDETKMKTMLGA